MGSQRVGHDRVANIFTRFVIAFLPRSKHRFNFMTAVTVHSDFGAEENKLCHYFYVFPIYLPWSDGTSCHDLFLECRVVSQLFHSPHSFSSRGPLDPLLSLPLEWYHPYESEVADISPSTLDSSWGFIYPSILHYVLCI